jgi:ketosteroid isomerase-like protein
MKKVTVLFVPTMIVLLCAALFGQGGRGRGAAPPATGPIADATNRIVEAVNKADAAGLQKALTADAVIADEDGHVGLPGSAWVTKITGGTAPRKLAITNLRVGEIGDAGWAIFAYTLDETANGAPNQMKGTSTIVYKKTGTDWQAAVIQVSVNGKAIQPH